MNRIFLLFLVGFSLCMQYVDARTPHVINRNVKQSSRSVLEKQLVYRKNDQNVRKYEIKAKKQAKKIAAVEKKRQAAARKAETQRKKLEAKKLAIIKKREQAQRRAMVKKAAAARKAEASKEKKRQAAARKAETQRKKLEAKKLAIIKKREQAQRRAMVKRAAAARKADIVNARKLSNAEKKIQIAARKAEAQRKKLEADRRAAAERARLDAERQRLEQERRQAERIRALRSHNGTRGNWLVRDLVEDKSTARKHKTISGHEGGAVFEKITDSVNVAIPTLHTYHGLEDLIKFHAKQPLDEITYKLLKKKGINATANEIIFSVLRAREGHLIAVFRELLFRPQWGFYDDHIRTRNVRGFNEGAHAKCNLAVLNLDGSPGGSKLDQSCFVNFHDGLVSPNALDTGLALNTSQSKVILYNTKYSGATKSLEDRQHINGTSKTGVILFLSAADFDSMYPGSGIYVGGAINARTLTAFLDRLAERHAGTNIQWLRHLLGADS